MSVQSDLIMVIGVKPRSLLNFRGQLLKKFVERGYKVVACSGPASEDIVDRLRSIGVKHQEVPFQRNTTNPFLDLSGLLKLRRLFKRFRPKKILLYTVKPVVYGSIAARGLGIEVYSLITGTGYAFSKSGLKQNLVGLIVEKMYKIALSSNNAVIFQNHDDRELFCKLNLLRSDILTYCVNGSGVDTQYFYFYPLPDEPVFLSIARLMKSKGVREYVDAARKVRKIRLDVRFLLLGLMDSNPEAISEEEVRFWNEEGVIEYIGTAEDVRPIISQARYYVLPSYREGTPRSVLEAMSMGRPVITTDVPGCRETVEHGVNGFLVRSQDSNHLAETILFLLQETDTEIQKMAKNSRYKAKEKFDVHKVNSDMLRIMDIN